MNLPPEFVSNIQNTIREDGYAFLEALPASIEEASAKWGLTNFKPAPVLSYNFVAFAAFPSPFGRGARGEGRDVVLKIGCSQSRVPE